MPVTICAAAVRPPRRSRWRKNLVAGGDDPQASATEAERRRVLELSLRLLPEKERAALVLRDLEGLTTEETARVLGSSEATVRSQVSKARAKVHDFVERYFSPRKRGTDMKPDEAMSIDLLREAHREPIPEAHFAAVRARVLSQIASERGVSTASLAVWLRSYGRRGILLLTFWPKPPGLIKRVVARIPVALRPDRLVAARGSAYDTPSVTRSIAPVSRAHAPRTRRLRGVIGPPEPDCRWWSRCFTDDPNVVIYWISERNRRIVMKKFWIVLLLAVVAMAQARDEGGKNRRNKWSRSSLFLNTPTQRS